MSIIDLGKSQGTSNPVLTQEQLNDIAQTTAFKGSTVLPALGSAIQGTFDTYNQGAQGVQNATQNQASVANQAQQTLGSTGESALRQGVTGMESLFNPNYEANQIAAALSPAQAQYQQNLMNQRALFGGSGELGSAREALAEAQTAGSTQAAQMATAAQVQKDIAAQRAATGANLAQVGQQGLQGAVTAAGVPVTAAQTGLDYFNKILAGIQGTPTASYTPNFTGTQGTTKTGSSFGLNL